MSNINLTINEKTVSVPNGTTVFEAASTLGIFIPHYCYHPDLSIAGVCRMCMVEIERNPRPQISCNTQVAEGMVVHTDTQNIKDMVKGVLELHLINHPLDCPICDKAGECKLQDFHQQYGVFPSRMAFDKVHKPKVQDIGTIMLDSERCILCTRCVRFTAEVTRSNELGIFNRGDRSELRTFDGGPLANEYTGNLADICPVGALTAKDFRFQCRVWFLDKTDTVCGLCAQGCNTTVSVNPQTKTLYRVEPRRNPDVNKSWICDEGRWGFHRIRENRIAEPLHRGRERSWEDAFCALHRRLSEQSSSVLVFLSTQMTNEEIIDSFQTLSAMGIRHYSWLVDEEAAAELKPYDSILRHRDKTANVRGFLTMAKLLGIPNPGLKSVAKNLGVFSTIIVLGLEGETAGTWLSFASAISPGTMVVIHASQRHASFENGEWVLPNVTVYERSGTFMNAGSRLQKVSAVIAKQGLSRNAHDVVWGIHRGNDRTPTPRLRASALFDEIVAPAINIQIPFAKLPVLGVAL